MLEAVETCHVSGFGSQTRLTAARADNVPHHIFYILDLVQDQIHAARQGLNLRLRAPVDFEIQLAADAIFSVLPILAHHDDRRLNGGQHG